MSNDMRFRVTSAADMTAYLSELRSQFPGAKFGCPSDRKPPLSDLGNMLESGSEEIIQEFLAANPYLIQYAVLGSGHHGIWAFPKQMIRPRGADGTSGLIPDFLIVTRSSLGYFWNVVELKRFDVQFSNRKGDGYSSEGNRALAQCSSYLAHFQDYIDAVRSNVRIPELIQPEGAILLMGDSENESDAQRQCRSNFVRNNPKIDVVSYRRIINGLESDLRRCSK
ncbi:MAG: Shedu anti-phage system protein SduA domain-containing protein [Parvibaculaceae bacterium]